MTTQATLTLAIIHAASIDIGNRSMRGGGRTVWNESDWNAAVDEQIRLTAYLDKEQTP